MTRWRRGFFRLWIVSSALWIGGAALAIHNQAQPFVSPECRAAVQKQQQKVKPDNPYSGWAPIPSECSFDELAAIQNPRDLKSWAVPLGAPPLVALLLGALLAWVASGFRPRRPTA